MGAENTEITEEIPEITLSYIAGLVEALTVSVDTQLDELAKRLDHADTMRHIVARQVAEIHTELETVKPMIERWQHSRIRKLAAGQMPWQ
jgi:hypothetical protein